MIDGPLISYRYSIMSKIVPEYNKWNRKVVIQLLGGDITTYNEIAISLLDQMRASKHLLAGNLGSTSKQKELDSIYRKLESEFPVQLGQHVDRREDILRWMAKSCKRSYVRENGHATITTPVIAPQQPFASTIISVERPLAIDTDVASTIFLPEEICCLPPEENNDLEDGVSIDRASYHALIQRLEKNIQFDPVHERIVYRFKSKPVRISDDGGLRAALMEMQQRRTKRFYFSIVEYTPVQHQYS